MPTALQGFRENNRERRGVGPPCQHSRAFSASGKGLKRWPLILSPTLRKIAFLAHSQPGALRECGLAPRGTLSQTIGSTALIRRTARSSYSHQPSAEHFQQCAEF